MKRLTQAITNRALPAVVGGAAGLAVNKVIPSSLSPTVRSLIKIAAGAIIPEFSPKSEMLKFGCAGLVGQAGSELIGSIVPALEEVKGIGSESEYVIDQDFVEGPEDEEYADGLEGIEEPLSGTDDPLAGIDD